MAQGHLPGAIAAIRDHVFVTSPSSDSSGRLSGNTSDLLTTAAPEPLFLPENVVCTSTVVARREILVAAGGFSDSLRAQDLDTGLRLLDRDGGPARTARGARYAVDPVYQAPDLRDRRRAGAERVRKGHEDEPWMTEAFRDRTPNARAWDDLRHARRRADLPTASHGASRPAVHGSTPRALSELLHHGRRARRRSATMMDS